MTSAPARQPFKVRPNMAAHVSLESGDPGQLPWTPMLSCEVKYGAEHV